jgi:hypothetical protein
MTQFGPVDGPARYGGVANCREIGAYAIAQALKLVVAYALIYSGLTIPLYTWARTAGPGASLLLNVGFIAAYGALILVVFLLLRGAFGGVPDAMAAAGRSGAIVTRGGEIGAFVIAYAITAVIQITLNIAVMNEVYISLIRNGQRALQAAVAFAVSVVAAAVVYAIFIALRSIFCRP